MRVRKNIEKIEISRRDISNINDKYISASVALNEFNRSEIK